MGQPGKVTGTPSVSFADVSPFRGENSLSRLAATAPSGREPWLVCLWVCVSHVVPSRRGSEAGYRRASRFFCARRCCKGKDFIRHPSSRFRQSSLRGGWGELSPLAPSRGRDSWWSLVTFFHKKVTPRPQAAPANEALIGGKGLPQSTDKRLTALARRVPVAGRAPTGSCGATSLGEGGCVRVTLISLLRAGFRSRGELPPAPAEPPPSEREAVCAFLISFLKAGFRLRGELPPAPAEPPPSEREAVRAFLISPLRAGFRPGSGVSGSRPGCRIRSR